MDHLLLIGIQNAAAASILALAVFGLTRLWRNPLLGRALWLLVLVKLVTPPLWEIPVDAAILGGAESPQRTAVDAAGGFAVAESVANIRATVPWFDDGVSTGPAPALPPEATMVTPAVKAADSVAHVVGSSSEPVMPAQAGIQEARTEPPALDSRLRGNDGGIQGAELGGTLLGGSLQRVSLSDFLSLFWLTGSGVVAVLTGGRLWTFSRRLRRYGTTDEGTTSFVEALAREVGLTRSPTVLVTEAAHPPLVWSWGRRPVVVLPRSLMRQLDEDEQRSVLIHELLHIKRGDHLVRLLEAAAMVLFLVAAGSVVGAT